MFGSRLLKPRLPVVVAAGLLCVAADGCPSVALLVSKQTSRFSPTWRTRGPCVAYFPQNGARLEPTPPPNPGEVMAGYKTAYFRGAEPARCDRWDYNPVEGVFDFDVDSVARPRNRQDFQSATLTLAEFRPNEPVRVVTDGGNGSLPEARNKCYMRVGLATGLWTPGAEPSGFVPHQPLAAVDPRIEISEKYVPGSAILDVTAEVGAWYRGEVTELGFVLYPDDPSGEDSHSSNVCLGFYTFSLGITLTDPPPPPGG